MGKVIGLLLVVCGLWVGLEVFNQGVDGAFDGAFNGGKTPIAERRQTTAQRVGSTVEDAQAATDARRARMLGE